MTSQYFTTCPKGLENLLNQEITDLGADQVRATVAGVYFSGGLELAYKVCLWSRLANKVLLPLGKASVNSAEDLYRAAKAIPWESHFPEAATLIVDFLGSNKAIRHTQFGAQTVKDAIVDRIKEVRGERPNVAKQNPDLRINARLAKNEIHISLDLSGESLHRRGYRLGQGGAPLKENLAAAILMRAGWLQMASERRALLDPMCGSGTFLIEGAMIATGMAPGLLRARRGGLGFGFLRWAQHDQSLWQPLVDDAEQQLASGLAAGTGEIRGYDQDPRVLGNARKNICAAGLDDFIRVSEKSVADFKKPTHAELSNGLMVCNPPYGERLGEIEALKYTYQTLGAVAKLELPGWTLAVFTGNRELGKAVGLWAAKKYQLFNGAIASELLLFELRSEGEQVKVDAATPAANKTVLNLRECPLSAGAEMVFNRLLKNRKKLDKWVKRENIQCYRVYDADMPEYSAAIDVYQFTDGRLKLHVQEYAPPKTVDAEKAQARFEEILLACAHAYELDDEHLITKQRVRNRGKQQYEKLGGNRSEQGVVREGNADLQVNLTDYLDSGLFLDHRPLRLLIAEQAKGKQFLNLFCYTATATVHAALAGAKSSVSVDMSNTYLDWAKENFTLNNIHQSQHMLVRANCMDWLKNCRQGFDLIMLDPPSFSNSKKMEGVLDVQRDHVALIERCMDLLNPGGCLYFSNNLRSFKLDESALCRYQIANISAQTLDPDFQHNPKIHQCWEIRQA
ncbi:bifunctional 23S rRNA (guanine(2069)-N(7))-methyltransferase RlmK/23S rRNA (guanine(2445)-N(2))-methyltransferase RlmL [Teredinibacter turnerae]|uniref:bifunctional 23S rRNA (guanine(2069)-N(7))-methyltransferase RlmK/23S rRNA (guanine(2445)-N(2))-methyltransferase RlmL n=1 Tax=Teredinibacter turnerae TaxID=2426 RepID=UPI0030D40606